MKLYVSVGPNPHTVRMFMAERGITLPTQTVDIMAGENRKPEYLAINPGGQSPALVLGDGSVITEITAICEYLDETNDGPRLMGDTAEARAQTRRWMRWFDLEVMWPLAQGFRGAEGLPMFKDRMYVFPEAAGDLKAMAQQQLAFLNDQLAGRAFMAGEKFSVADILAYCFIAFGEQVGQPLNRDLTHLAKWYDTVAARESASV